MIIDKFRDVNSYQNTFLYASLVKSNSADVIVKQLKKQFSQDIKKYNLKCTVQDVINEIEQENVDLAKFAKTYYAYQKMSGLPLWTSYIESRFDKSLTNKKIYIPYVEYFLPLVEYIKKDNQNQYTLQTNDYKFYVLLKDAICKDYKHITVINNDVYSEELVELKFDYIISMPPLMGKLNLDNYISSDITGISFEALSKSLRKNGKLLIILPPRITFVNDIKALTLREYIENNFSIEEISEYPQKGWTSIKLINLVLQNSKQTNKITIREYKFAEGDYSYELNREKSITKEELKKANLWSPNFFLENTSLTNYKESNISKIRLGEYCTILRGRAYNPKTPKRVKQLNVKDIESDYIKLDNLENIEIDIQTQQELYLKDGDIVLPCRGSGSIKFGIIKSVKEDIVPSQNIVLIRVINDKLKPEFLRIFLESPIGNELINSIQRGEAIKQISHKDIAQLEIPLLSIEEQDLIIKNYKKGKQEYETTTQNALKKWNDLKSDLYSKFC